MHNFGFKKKLLAGFFMAALVLFLSYYFIPKLSEMKTPTELVQAAPTNGLVAYWKFDDGAGLEALDGSGHGNTAILSNSPVWTGGKFGGAIQTDGMDDLIRINPFSFNGDITVVTWLKQELTGGHDLQSTLIVAMDSAGARKFAVLLDRINKRFCIQTPTTDSCTDSNTYTVTGSWFHFALTKSAKAMKIYVNGAPVNRDLVTEAVAGNDVGIGRYTAVESRGCNCSFDEFRIYNRALAANEITGIYNDHGVAVISQPAPSAAPSAAVTGSP